MKNILILVTILLTAQLAVADIKSGDPISASELNSKLSKTVTFSFTVDTDGSVSRELSSDGIDDVINSSCSASSATGLYECSFTETYVQNPTCVVSTTGNGNAGIETHSTTDTTLKVQTQSVNGTGGYGLRKFSAICHGRKAGQVTP